MKLALILAANIRNAPYIQYYIKILKVNNIDFQIINWNKENISEEGCISYDKSTDLSKPRLFRIFSVIKFNRFVIKQLKKNKYDKLIVFGLTTGALLYPYLMNNFKNNYYFDIRDYTNIYRFYSFLIHSLIENSFTTAISSPGFLKWLPESKKYHISHNYSFYEHCSFYNQNNVKTDKYIILTIGQLRDFETNKNVINVFENNESVSLKFVGFGNAYEPLLKYTLENNIKNVIFTGRYEKEEEIEYLRDSSLLNIILDDNLNSKTLMTNRIYLAISNGIPVMVNKNTTQGDYVEKYNLGIVSENMNLLDQDVASYFQSFDKKKFERGCKNFLVDIKTDQVEFEKDIEAFITR